MLEFVAIKSQNNSELTIPGVQYENMPTSILFFSNNLLIYLLYLQGLIELGNSVSKTLGLYFKKQIFPAVTPAFSEEKALTEEIILTMIQSSVEVCCIDVCLQKQ